MYDIVINSVSNSLSGVRLIYLLTSIYYSIIVLLIRNWYENRSKVIKIKAIQLIVALCIQVSYLLFVHTKKADITAVPTLSKVINTHILPFDSSYIFTAAQSKNPESANNATISIWVKDFFKQN